MTGMGMLTAVPTKLELEVPGQSTLVLCSDPGNKIQALVQ